MILIIKIALFLLGLCLSVQIIAALYGIIDLKYTAGTAYLRVIRGILIWGILIIAIAWLLSNTYRPVFLWGLVVFLLFHFGTYLGQRLLLIRNARLLLKEGESLEHAS
jgi:hypothetical protein